MTAAARLRRLAKSDAGVLAGIAVLDLLLHVATNGQYGFHRDELATVDDARRLAWGYVAYPPLAPAVARMALLLFGPSLRGLRFFAALAASVAVALTGSIARALGARRGGQVAAALAAAIGPTCLAAGALFQYVAFDFLWWTVAAWAVANLVSSGDRRWWLVVGAALGAGAETKYTIAFCAAGIAAGTLAERRGDVSSKWPWLGAALAILLAAPNALWQARHGFVSLEFLRSIHARDVEIGRTAGFLADQLTDAANLVTIPLWAAGLAFLLAAPPRKGARMLAWMAIVPFLLFWAAHGRGYYTAPIYPPLLASGAVFWERRVAAMTAGRRAAAVAAAAILFVAGSSVAVATLPIAPIGSRLWRFAVRQNGDFVEEVGWPELVREVARIHRALPPEDRARTAILAGNYGEAGAVDLYGPPLGLPPAISGVNSYWARGPGDPPPEVVIALGLDRDYLERKFASCVLAGSMPAPYGVENEETTRHRGIFVCRRLRTSWPEFWRTFRHFG
ncbi:MAG TPA: glycosyltransferase family 39 protein [Thermoanaerobaculia bacterium]|nr:glycosyltransferase family 39 protein [Thermoanaerobaculia bacterium]